MPFTGYHCITPCARSQSRRRGSCYEQIAGINTIYFEGALLGTCPALHVVLKPAFDLYVRACQLSETRTVEVQRSFEDSAAKIDALSETVATVSLCSMCF